MVDLANPLWSQDDNSNDAAAPNGWKSAVMLPTQVEPTARAGMGALKRFYDHINATLTSGGTANAQTLTYAVAPAAYVTGDSYAFIVGNANTAAATLNVNGLGDIPIQIGSNALTGYEMQVGHVAVVHYDGSAFQLLLGSANAITPPLVRGYIDGLTLSTAGNSATFSVAAGVANDSTNAQSMTLAAISKTTAGWAVGNGNGSLDAGAIAPSTWYHVWEIKRPDTGVVDVLTSLSATAPTMPANYTLKRRLGSLLTNNVSRWVSFVQTGNTVIWTNPQIAYTSGNAPGAVINIAIGGVPVGVSVTAILHGVYLNSATGVIVYVQEASTSSNTAGPAGYTVVGDLFHAFGRMLIETNNSAQVLLGASAVNTTLDLITMGYIDPRGQNAP